jgi:transcriptional accessory protein Tex/SPT6
MPLIQHSLAFLEKQKRKEKTKVEELEKDLRKERALVKHLVEICPPEDTHILSKSELVHLIKLISDFRRTIEFRKTYLERPKTQEEINYFILTEEIHDRLKSSLENESELRLPFSTKRRRRAKSAQEKLALR